MKSSTTARQFVQWVEFLDRRWNKREKWEHYLAEIVLRLELLLAALTGNKPNRVRAEECFITFVREKEKKAMSAEEKMKISQMAWKGMFAGIRKKKGEDEKVEVRRRILRLKTGSDKDDGPPPVRRK